MKLKPWKIAVIILILCLLCGASIYGLLSFSANLIITKLNIVGIESSASIIFEFTKDESNKRLQSFAQMALLLSFALPIVIFGGLGFVALSPKKREQHGSAAFATRTDLVKSGLLVADNPSDKFPSIVIGKTDKDFLLFRGQEFMFLSAPTRSGKGVGIVIPNLLHYRDSVVVLDIKGENFDITSGFRAKCGQEVHKFSPDDEDSNTACWNPLGYVRDDPRFKLSDLMNITNILYPPSTDDVWSSTAESLFLGLALYCMETAKEKDNFNIPFIKKLAINAEFLKDEDTFNEYVKSRKNFEPLSEDALTYLRGYAQTSDKLRNSILISFNQPLGIFGDPITAKATSKNTFDLRDVRKKRMSIYVVIKPSNIDKFGKFLNLFFQQLLVLNMNELPQNNPDLKYQCLLLLDEFTAMGRVGIIEKASAYMAGYNMRLLLIFQSKSQVKDKKLYDETGAQTMLTNMALQVCFAPRDDNDAEDYSRMIGDMTWKGKSTSRQTGKGGGSVSTSDQKRAVMLPQEIKAIGKEREIISMENMPPALVDKIFWYKEPLFQSRANLPPPPVPSQLELTNSIEPSPETINSLYGGMTKSMPMPHGAMFEVGFSPKRNALEVVISFILDAKKELFVAAYSFTSEEITHSLIEAYNRGVDVRLIVDDAQNDDDQKGYKALDFLSGNGIPIIRSKNYAAMHHKFMVADGLHLQIGSFNYTKSANIRNAETAIAFRNSQELADVYRNEWLRLASEPNVGIDKLMIVNNGLGVLAELNL